MCGICAGNLRPSVRIPARWGRHIKTKNRKKKCCFIFSVYTGFVVFGFILERSQNQPESLSFSFSRTFRLLLNLFSLVQWKWTLGHGGHIARVSHSECNGIVNSQQQKNTTCEWRKEWERGKEKKVGTAEGKNSHTHTKETLGCRRRALPMVTEGD